MRYAALVFIFAIFVFLGLVVFGGGSNKSGNKPENVKTLADFADTNARMRLTIGGRITGNEDYRQIVITVGRDKRTVQVNKGYQGNVLKSKSFGNNSEAYDAFLHALDLAGYTRSRDSKFSNEDGQCPLGQRFVYEIIDNDDENMRTWSGSCNSPGTFKGQANLVQQLFQSQISNYNEFVSDVVL